MPQPDFILGALSDRQALVFSLYTGLNRYGIRLTIVEIARLLDTHPKSISYDLDNCRKRLTLLYKKGYL